MENEAPELDICSKYQPLFDLPKARAVIRGESDELDLDYARRLAKIDTVVMSGGRNSGKSYVLGLWDSYATAEYDYKTLFTRYTLTSAEDSIIPNFMDKMAIMGYDDQFKTVKNKVMGRNKKQNPGSVTFRGMKTSSGNQTAALKSLEGFSCFIVDEAEEVPDYETFNKIYLSIRTQTHQNLSILSFNPPDDEHWIFKKMFLERGVPGQWNGIKDNVLYIHTTYLDLNPKFVPQSVEREFNRMKATNIEEYNQVALGHWTKFVKGALFHEKEFQKFSFSELNLSNIDGKYGFIDVADRGMDYLSFPIIYKIGNFCYVVDWYFTQDNSSITLPACAEYIKHHKLDYVGVESNGVGSVFATTLNENVPDDSTVMFVHEKANKHTRIVTHAAGVRMKYVFRNDVPTGGMYDLAMRQFFRYNKDKTENEFDDAPDSITGSKILIDDLSQY